MTRRDRTGLRNWWLRGLGALTATAALLGANATASTATAATPELTLQTMTFNTCANTKPTGPHCINGQNTAKVSADLARRLNELHPDVKVVFLQEVCYDDIVALRKLVTGWQFRFTGIKDEGSGSQPTGTVAPRPCANSRGNFGISVGVRASSATFTVHYYPHVPMARDRWGHWNVRQAAICADVAAWNVRACGTHLTPAGSSGVFHDAQAGQVTDLISYGGGGSRVILGGDLNSRPPAKDSASTVGPLYDAYTECDQANYGGARDGELTYQKDDGTRTAKYDYIFANKNATTSCYVTDAEVLASDHVPVFATTTFPAE